MEVTTLQVDSNSPLPTSLTPLIYQEKKVIAGTACPLLLLLSLCAWVGRVLMGTVSVDPGPGDRWPALTITLSDNLICHISFLSGKQKSEIGLY